MANLLMFMTLFLAGTATGYAARGLAEGQAFVDGEICTGCTGAVNSLSSWANKLESLQTVEGFLQARLCPKLVDASKCAQYTGALLPTFASWIKETFTAAQLCSAEQVCGFGPNLLRPVSQSSRVSTADCPVCKYVVEYLSTIMDTTDISDATLEAAAKEICSPLPWRLNEGCLDFVHTYEARLVAVKDLFHDSNATCQIAGACHAELMQHRPPPLTPELAAGLSRAYHAGAGRNDLCNSCKASLAAVHDWLSDPNVHNAIMEYLQSLCKQLPALQNECVVQADEIVSALLAELAMQVANPDAACIALGFCPHQLPLVQMLQDVLPANALAGVLKQ